MISANKIENFWESRLEALSSSSAIKQDQISDIYKNTLANSLGQLVFIFMLTIILAGEVSSIKLFSWTFFIISVLASRNIAAHFFKKSKNNKDQGVDKWITFYQINFFLTGVSWGLVGFIFNSHEMAMFDIHFLMMAFISALSGIAIVTVGAIFEIYAAFVIPMAAIFIYNLLLIKKDGHTEVALITFFGIIFLLISAYKYSKSSSELLLQSKEVEQSQIDLIERLGRAGEYRDNDTGDHIKRMSYSSYRLALRCGLSKSHAKLVLLSSPMHDIGKIGIPDHVLLKKGKLNDAEWEIMKTHATLGGELLDNHSSPLMKMASTIAHNHHEKWNGTGYPGGLSKKEIPLEARIVSICDVFDALTSERPYKEAWSIRDSLEFMKKESGKQFDPVLLDHFLSIVPQIINSQENRDRLLS